MKKRCLLINYLFKYRYSYITTKCQFKKSGQILTFWKIIKFQSKNFYLFSFKYNIKVFLRRWNLLQSSKWADFRMIHIFPLFWFVNLFYGIFFKDTCFINNFQVFFFLFFIFRRQTEQCKNCPCPHHILTYFF